MTFCGWTRRGGYTQPDPHKRKLALRTWYAAVEERSLSIQPNVDLVVVVVVVVVVMTSPSGSA